MAALTGVLDVAGVEAAVGVVDAGVDDADTLSLHDDGFEIDADAVCVVVLAAAAAADAAVDAVDVDVAAVDVDVDDKMGVEEKDTFFSTGFEF